MPYGKCTLCGSTMHLYVGDVESWYRERFPELKVGDIAPIRCLDCFSEITEGMEVQVRLSLGKHQAEVGAHGEVSRIYKSLEGELFEVRFRIEEKDVSDIFCRAEIRKVRK